MKKENINKWLKDGKQSKITPEIKKICSKFKGDNLEKIFQILNWIDKNSSYEKDYDKVLKIFASRTADQLIKDKSNTGGHDTVLLLVTFLRAIKIPTKYLLGYDKISPHYKGHCAAKAYINKNWVLIDPGAFQVNLIPSRSSFYHYSYIVKEGLDAWDCGIKTHNDWKKISDNLIKNISKNLIK